MSTVAFVVSDVGYHWEEVAAAYKKFKAGGWNVTFYVLTGRKPSPDF